MDLLTRPAPFLLVAWALLALAFAGLWWRQLRTRNATAVDAAWSGAIGLLALAAALAMPGAALQRALVAVTAGLWSLRLSWHLLADRTGRGAPEDGRYRALRTLLGPRAGVGFFAVYQLQALLALAFAAPFVFAASAAIPTVTGVQFAGLAIAAAGQGFVWTADRQLAAWRRDPAARGRACRRGLWRYSRHPNYFFEWLTWCGFGLVHQPALGWAAALAPVAMGLSIRFFTGVPFTEKRALASRGDDYRRYMAETNTFFPGPPRQVPPVPSNP